MSLMTTFAHWTQRWRPQPDAGTVLRRAEDTGQVRVWGDDPLTCTIELVSPPFNQYTCPPRIPLDAWLAAWRVTRFPAAERDQAIRQDLTLFRAGLVAVAWLDVDGTPDDVLRRIRYDEAVVVAHHWWLLHDAGVVQGQRRFASLQAQVRFADVEWEARLLFAGVRIHHGVGERDAPGGTESWEVGA